MAIAAPSGRCDTQQQTGVDKSGNSLPICREFMLRKEVQHFVQLFEANMRGSYQN
jgi:hypothetical protein